MPNRYLREEIVTSRWNRCSWMGQSFYIRLLGLVCDYGRHEANPTILCAQAFPTYPHFRTATVRKLLKELVENELITLYTVSGKPYLQILRWRERVRQRLPKYPGPTSDAINGHSAIDVTPPSKVADRCGADVDKQSVSPNPPLANDRHEASNCSPPTPDALALQPKYINGDGEAGGDSSKSASKSRAPRRLHSIPASVEEVIAYGQSVHPKIPEAQCRSFWAHYEGQARTNENGDIFWVTSGDAVVTNWKVKLPQFRTLHDPHRATHQRGAAQRPDRNVGTANEGNHTKYGNLGKVVKA